MTSIENKLGCLKLHRAKIYTSKEDVQGLSRMVGTSYVSYENSCTEPCSSLIKVCVQANTRKSSSLKTWDSEVITSFVNTRTIGLKNYEIADHLGNTRNIFTDIRLSTKTGTANPNIVFASFTTDARAIYNYYAFGMPKTSAYDYAEATIGGAYRYGFNGKEKDNELKGSGNSLDFGARIYDSRLGRFLSVDPWDYKYAWQSSYAYYRNSPISAIDYKGKGDGKYYNTNAEEIADDGIEDGKKYITHDKSELKKATDNKGVVKADDMKKSILLPKNNPFPSMLKRTLSPNTKLEGNLKGNDSEGGLHEESTICTFDQNYDCKPGDANYAMDLTSEGGIAAETRFQTTDVNGNTVPQNNTVILLLHSHPTASGHCSPDPSATADWDAQRAFNDADYLAPNAVSAVLSADNNRNPITFFTTNGKKDVTLFSITLFNINKIYNDK